MAKQTTKQIKPDKLDRLKKVKWDMAAVERRDISDVTLIDEILDEGLAIREERLAKLKQNEVRSLSDV